MNILVTGGAGFIGSHIVDAYINDGHTVIVVDDLSSGFKENVNPRAEFYKLDIRSEELQKIFDKHNIEIVNHHAAQMDVRKSVADPKYDASLNIIGGLNVFETARRHGVRKFIFSSTGGAVYGEQDYFPADEQHPLRPLSPYGITKLCTEKYLFYYKEVYGIDYVILRYANVYGPRQNSHGEAGVVAIFAEKMLHGDQPIINGNGKQTRDYTHVADVVKANLLALHSNSSDVFNIGTGTETTVNEVFLKLRQYLNPSCLEKHGPAKQGEQRRSVVSYEKIQKKLGWTPSVSLDEGLRMTAEFFKKKAH
ncbi:MAG: NAD-dependent epimerase/dehydratase family protein [Ignavibacteriales bacterium]|nr:NAD-dependent epimerase/dehydratase family protein [Ignavibacteriales bacterium]MBI3788406.1 NAD-dependent epimerase/dehydratase family protein [Ignavibacteriales bacterium]